MKIEIGCAQRFDVTVTRELVALLTKLGSMHYDGHCKSSVTHGGFIYGWSVGRGMAEPESPTIERATNRELQTCLKICECPPRHIMSAEEQATLDGFVRLGYAALRQASEDPRFSQTIPVEVNP